MKVLMVASQKGGSGKSTLARCLAVAALFDEIPTVCVDADPQGTLAKWATRRSAAAPTVVTTATDPLPRVLAQMRDAGAALAVVDSPPHLRAIISIGAEHADAVLIPCRPTVDDLEAIGGTIEIVSAFDRSVGFVLNAVPSRTAGHGITFARSALKQFQGIALCPHEFGERVAFHYSATTGQTPLETEPAGKAAAEIRAVWTWCRGLLKLS